LAIQLKEQDRINRLTEKEDAKIRRKNSELESENARLQEAKF